MPVYFIRTRVNSNVPASSLLYDLSIYRMNGRKNKHILVDVKQQRLKENYETQLHMTDNISDSLPTIYIMEVRLYRMAMLPDYHAYAERFTRLYTLEELSTGKAWSQVKRENPCYFESSAMTKPVSEGPNIKFVIISQPERPFIAEDYPEGSPQDPFVRTIIEKQIYERFNYVNLPYQGQISTCGPAAFFYCLLKDRPDIYAQAAWELWRYGKTKIGELEIAPGEGCRHPSGAFYDNNGLSNISGLDWMTLAGLRDSENTIMSFDTIDSPFAGITLWQTLEEWFEKAGYEKIFSNVGITQVGVQGIRELNEYVTQGYKVITLISDGLLDGSKSNLTVPTHWIVWDGSVTHDENGFVQLNLFSWGQVKNWIKSEQKLSFFINRFFGGMVFRPLS